jgi:hypothetical protein
MTEDRRQKTEDRRQKTEDRRQKNKLVIYVKASLFSNLVIMTITHFSVAQAAIS